MGLFSEEDYNISVGAKSKYKSIFWGGGWLIIGKGGGLIDHNSHCYLILFSAKPIDLLAQYVSSDDNDLEIQMHEPYTILVVSSVDGMYC